MAYSAMAVANAFIKRKKEGVLPDLTPMKLQKLLYFAQAHYLRHYRSPLIDDFFARWTYGPVIPSLYHEFKEYGAGQIADFGGHIVLENGSYARKRPIIADEDVQGWAIVDAIVSSYGKFSGPQLSSITHQPGTPWSIGGGDGTPITNDQLLSSAVI